MILNLVIECYQPRKIAFVSEINPRQVAVCVR